MTQLEGDQPSIQRHLHQSLDLTANEYRLLADLLLDHMGTDEIRTNQFNSLAQRLFVLAVRADRAVIEIASD